MPLDCGRVGRSREKPNQGHVCLGQGSVAGLDHVSAGKRHRAATPLDVPDAAEHVVVELAALHRLRTGREDRVLVLGGQDERREVQPFAKGRDVVVASVAEPCGVNNEEMRPDQFSDLPVAAERADRYGDRVLEGATLSSSLRQAASAPKGRRGAVNAPGGWCSAPATRSRLSAETASPRSTRSIVDRETPAKLASVPRFQPIMPR